MRCTCTLGSSPLWQVPVPARKGEIAEDMALAQMLQEEEDAKYTNNPGQSGQMSSKKGGRGTFLFHFVLWRKEGTIRLLNMLDGCLCDVFQKFAWFLTFDIACCDGPLVTHNTIQEEMPLRLIYYIHNFIYIYCIIPYVCNYIIYIYMCTLYNFCKQLHLQYLQRAFLGFANCRVLLL